MSVKIGINGFGRIGRMVLRNSLNMTDVEVVAINDLVSTDYLAYLLKHDSSNGILKNDISFDENHLYVDGKKISIVSEKNPENISWKNYGAEYIVESTGLFLTQELAKKHLQEGVKNVVLSAPAKDETPMFVMGVNHNDYKKEMKIVSNASCTTNCLTPIMEILDREFSVKSGQMTTIHASTATQNIVDGASPKNWRLGRSAMQNIIPSSTGAAKAVTKILPNLKNKLNGMSFRVPTANVSVVDLSINFNEDVSFVKICEAIKNAAESNRYKGIIGYSNIDVVSSDFLGDSRSSIFDEKASMQIDKTFYKLIFWYDNEWAYSHKIIELIKHIDKKNNS
ncbi:MAG: type I glyceraldehyde-3-phosphate dehydrogenase [Flavobacteriales bacterium]|jgi:glyceraldehyde 3-phosphate dehydrogenase|tara:strand:- start:246 stop:1259 length:1014 start_codon:yes stop_codon:yes gene_type:complete